MLIQLSIKWVGVLILVLPTLFHLILKFGLFFKYPNQGQILKIKYEPFPNFNYISCLLM
jgi:hypothetical protein